MKAKWKQIVTSVDLGDIESNDTFVRVFGDDEMIFTGSDLEALLQREAEYRNEAQELRVKLKHLTEENENLKEVLRLLRVDIPDRTDTAFMIDGILTKEEINTHKDKD